MILLILWLALIGALAWALTTYVPMPPAMRTVIVAVAVIFGIILVLNAFGVAIGSMPVPR